MNTFGNNHYKYGYWEVSTFDEINYAEEEYYGLDQYTISNCFQIHVQIIAYQCVIHSFVFKLYKNKRWYPFISKLVLVLELVDNKNSLRVINFCQNLIIFNAKVINIICLMIVYFWFKIFRKKIKRSLENKLISNRRFLDWTWKSKIKIEMSINFLMIRSPLFVKIYIGTTFQYIFSYNFKPQ